MEWKLTKKQLAIILLYSSLVPLSGYIGETFYNIAVVLNAPFLPIGWMGGKLLVSTFNVGIVYKVGLFASIFIQAYLVAVNTRHYLKKDKLNLARLILRIAIMISIFVAAVFTVRLLYI